MFGAGRSDERPKISLAKRSMSVVVRPTYTEHDQLYGNDINTTMLKGQTCDVRYSSSSSSTMPPSLMMHLLKKRSPYSTVVAADPHSDASRSTHDHAINPPATETLKTGRLTSFDSTNSLHSSSSSSMRRSASVPDLRHHGDESASEEDGEDGLLSR